MGIREELKNAIQVDEFPSSSLLARTMARVDEPPSTVNGWQAVAGLAAVLVAGIVIGAIRLAHTGHGQVQPATTAQASSLPSAREGLMSYRFVSTQVGWISVFRPDGRTVVARTSDGGKHWEQKLVIDGLTPGTPAEFLTASVAVIIGQQQGYPARLPPAVWITTDGGGHWEMRPAPSQIGDLVSADFIDASYGWILTTETPTWSRVTVYQTTTGGRLWSKVASSETSPALGGADSKVKLKFASVTAGWIESMESGRRDTTTTLYGTQDGGRTWDLENRPAAGLRAGGSRVSLDLPTFFDERVGIAVVTVTSARPSPCASPPPPSLSITCFPLIGTFVSITGDAGRTWSAPERSTADGTLSFIDRQRWIAIGPDWISSSMDAGSSWRSYHRLPPLPAGWTWATSQTRFLDATHGWISISTWSGGRLLTMGSAGRPGPFNMRIQGTSPRFALLATADGGAHWSEVQVTGID